MKARWATPALVLLAGCKLYFGDPDEGGDPTGDAQPPGIVDAQPGIDAPQVANCPTSRPNECVVDVTGTVLDFVARTPYAGMPDVDFNTAWDSAPPFPAACDPLVTFVPDTAGAFAMTDTVCDSPLFPPIVMLLVQGGSSDPRAPTATDARLSCTGSDCGAINVSIPVPSAELATSWRNQLQAEGMVNATTRGLVIFEFRDTAGNPQAGVTPFVRDIAGDRPLLAPGEMRFISGTRDTLIRSDATMTGSSGLAIIALADASSAFIGGTRAGGMTWEPVGVLFADGWIFLEDKTPTP